MLEQFRTSSISESTFYRILLGVVLTILIVLTFTLGGSGGGAKKSVATTSTTVHHSHKPPVTKPQIPKTNPAPANWQARGCNFSTRATHVSPLGRCTVVAIGDSVGEDLAIGLANQVSRTHSLRFVSAAQSSTGLIHSGYFNWPRHLTSLMSRFRPHLVIVCMGANDHQNIDVNGTAAPFGSRAWQKAYSADVRHIVTIATSRGARVLWVGVPIVGHYGYSQGIRLINGLDERVATSVPGVTFLPTWNDFATSTGAFRAFANVNNSWHALRTSDQIHFTSSGENVFGTLVVREMATIFHVNLTAAYPQVITS